MSSDDSAILVAIEKIYAAATDASLWPDVMHELLGLTESVAATFCAIEGSEEPKFASFTTLNFEQAFVDEYLRGMMRHDPTVQYIVAHPHQHLVHDSQFISEREKDKHFYYDWHHSFSDTRHRLAGMFSLNTQLTSGITLHRTRRQGDYEHAHIERLEFLLPHLQRAVSIAFRLETFGAMQRMSFQLLDAHTAGIVVLDERGQVVFANRAVQTLTSAQDGIALSKQGFSLRNQVDQRKLQELIARALALVDRAVREPAGFMQLYRASGKRPYSVLVAPLCRGNAILNQARPAVCVVITDPESDPGLTAEMLHTLYGLTGAEARLASAIAAGKRLQSAAEELGITYKTARTHLVSIFRKTGTARQGELVRLLLSEVWPKI